MVDKFLSLANVSSLDEARQLPTSELLEANRLLISDSAYGTSTTGPVVDGVLVPKFPDQLLAEGRFQHDIDILIGYNNNEGLVFTSPAVTNDSEFRYFLETTYSNAEPEILDHIENDLYPSVFNGSFGYTNQTQRAALTKSESEFICRYGFIQAAYGDRAKSYHFSIVPSLHGFDLPYVFYNALEGKTDVDASTAIIFQQLLTSFAAHGVATSPHLQTPVPAYGQDRLMLSVNGTGFPVIKDPSFQNRCEFWQKGSYL